MPLRKTQLQRQFLSVHTPPTIRSSPTTSVRSVEFHLENLLGREEFEERKLYQIIRSFSTQSPREAAEILSSCLTNIVSKAQIHQDSRIVWLTWSFVARLFVLSGDVANLAYPLYQKIVQNLKPGLSSQLWFDIASMFYTGGNLSQAKTILVNLLAADPQFSDAGLVKFQLGRILRAQNKIPLSLVCFESLVETPPAPLTQSHIFFEIGLLYERVKVHDKAVEAYSRVVIGSLLSKALARIAWLHSQYPNLPDQLIMLQHSVQQLPLSMPQPQFPQRLAQQQQQHAHQHSRQQPQQPQQIVTQQPQPQPHQIQQPPQQQQSTQPPRRDQSGFEISLSLFHTSLKIDPNDVTTHLLLARALSSNNKPEAAFTVISNAISQFPSSVAIWCEMGTMYFNATQYNDAYMAFERALLKHQCRHQPVPEVIFNMGVVLDALEKHDEAKTKYRDAFAISRHPAIEDQYNRISQESSKKTLPVGHNSITADSDSENDSDSDDDDDNHNNTNVTSLHDSNVHTRAFDKARYQRRRYKRNRHQYSSNNNNSHAMSTTTSVSSSAAASSNSNHLPPLLHLEETPSSPLPPLPAFSASLLSSFSLPEHSHHHSAAAAAATSPATAAPNVFGSQGDHHSHARDSPLPPLGIPRGIPDYQKMIGENNTGNTSTPSGGLARRSM
eukprot:c5917_g1_i1.p1 GENE.c5917_g1_i1~~c5917_g1_i1.p1  ORF type:complete len:669 (+),score=171.28 c5917_g1_i1:198-2204(+)